MISKRLTCFVLLAVALSATLLPFLFELLVGTPICDSSLFRYIGHRVASGGVLYECAWDNKGPTLFVPQILGYLLFPNWENHGPGFIIMLMCLSSVLMTWLFARKIGLSINMAALSSLLYSVSTLACQGLYAQNSQEFIALFFITAGLGMSFDSIRCSRLIFMGGCAGMVFLIKPNLISFAAAIAILWIFDYITKRDVELFVRRVVCSASGFFVVLISVTAWFAIYGMAYEMWDASLLFGMFEYCHFEQSWLSWWANKLKGMLSTLGGAFPFLLYFAGMIGAFAGIDQFRRRSELRLFVYFLSWMLLETVMLFGFKTFYHHYMIVQWLPMALLLTYIASCDSANRKFILSAFSLLFAAIVWRYALSAAVFVYHGAVDFSPRREFESKARNIILPGEKVAAIGAFYVADVLDVCNAKTIQHFNARMNWKFSKSEMRKLKITSQMRMVLQDKTIKHLVAPSDPEKFLNDLVFWTGDEAASQVWRLMCAWNGIGIYERKD